MKSNQVFFIKNLTLDQEYELIFGDQPQKEVPEIPLIFGNKLLPTRDNLQDTPNITSSSTSLNSMVLMSLLANSIFYNLVKDVDEKINHRNVYLPFLSKLKMVLKNTCSLDIFQNSNTSTNNSNDALSIYRSIIKSVHTDLISCFLFEKEDWNT